MVARLVVALVLASASESNPVPRIVELLARLQEGVESDGAEEIRLYDEYACWCETTSGEKATAITAAGARLKELGQEISKLQGVVGSGTATLQKLEKDLAAATKAIADGDSRRTTEAAEYATQKDQYETGLRNLASAIDVLGAGTGTATASEAEAELLSVAAGVRAALKTLRPDHSSHNYAPLKSFLANPISWVQQQTSSPHLGTYQAQSTAIQGILKEMKDNFTRELAELNADEGKNSENAQNFRFTKVQEESQLQATLAAKTKEHGDAAALLAQDTVEREETQQQLANDEKTLEDTKASCTHRAKEHNSRVGARTEELTGIQEAISILESGAETFENATAFVQLPVRASVRQEEAYKELERISHGRPALSALASRVRSTGHFDRVIGSIDQMTKDLNAEEAEDLRKKKWCEAERHASQTKDEQLVFDLATLDATVERAQDKQLELRTWVNETKQDMDDVETALAASLDTRTEEHASFEKGQQEKAESVRLLAGAAEALGKFYANRAFVQKPRTLLKRRRQPAGASGSYGGRASETGGIVAILEHIREEVQKSHSQAAADEKFAADTYWKLRGEFEGELKELAEKKAEYERLLADRVKHEGGTERVRTATDASLTAVRSYVSDIEVSCDDAVDGFDGRSAERTASKSGLANAKLILQGASLPALAETRRVVQKTPAEELREASA